MTNLMSLQQYKAAHLRQNPNDFVREPEAINFPYATVVPLIVGLIAVNILSASHTAPVIAQSVPTNIEAIKIIVAIAAFIGVEFLMVVANFIPPDKGSWARPILILLGLAVAIVANVGSVVGTISVNGDVLSLIAGILIGIFAPVANYTTGELLRKTLDRTKEEQRIAKEAYREELKAYDERLKQLYISRYLKKYNITDATTIMRLSSGETMSTEPEQGTAELKTTAQPKATKAQSFPPRITALAEQLVANGDTELSYAKIQEKYHVGPSDVSKAKSYLQNR